MIERTHGKKAAAGNNVIDLDGRRQQLESARRGKKSEGGREGFGTVVSFDEPRIFGNGLKKCAMEYNKDGSSFFVYRIVPHNDIIDAKQRLEKAIESAGLSGIVDDSKITVESRVRSGIPYIEVMALEIEAQEDAFDRFCRALKKLVERIAPEL